MTQPKIDKSINKWLSRKLIVFIIEVDYINNNLVVNYEL